MLKGIVTLKLKEWDKKGVLQTVSSTTEENMMLKKVYDLLYNFLPVFTNAVTTRICISNESAAGNFNRSGFLNSVYATGDPSAFAANVSYNKYKGELLSTSNPSTLTYVQRFRAPEVTRTINSIGIATGASLIQNSLGSTVNNLLTYLKLATPVVQTASQVLDVTYKVFVDWNNSSFTNVDPFLIKLREDAFFGYSFNGSDKAFLQSNKFSTGHIPANGFYFIAYSENSDLNTHPYNDFSYSGNVSYHLVDPSSLKIYADFSTQTIKQSTPTPYSPNFVGRFLSSFLSGGQYPEIGSSMGRGHLIRQNMSKTSNLSSLTSHSTASTLPVYDAGALASSSWQPLITDSSNSDFPATYILKVTQSGGLGVGKYKIYKTGWGGWLRGAWKDPIADPFLHLPLAKKINDSLAPADNYDYYNYRWMFKWNSSLGEETFVSYHRSKGVGIYKLTDRSLNLLQFWNLNTINPNITQIYDLAVNFTVNYIYVATNVGLYSILTTNNTVTKLNPDKCLAVNVGNANSVFAVFNPSSGVGRISGSIGADWSTALSIGTPTPLINWNNIWRIFIDRDSSSYNMMIIEGISPKGVVTIPTVSPSVKFTRRWWNNSSGIVSSDVSSTVNSTSSTTSSLVSDLICFPTHNSVLAKNGVWVYPQDIYQHHAGFSTITSYQGIPFDLSEDLLNSGYSYYSNNRSYYNTAESRQTIGTGTTINGNRLLNKVKVAVGFFAGPASTTIQTNAASVGDWIKPKLPEEGNNYNVVFSMSEHYGISNTANFIKEETSKTSAINSLNTVSSLNLNTASEYSEPQRLGLFYVCLINTNSSPVGTILNYPEYGAGALYSIDYRRGFNLGNVITTADKRILIADRQTDNANTGGFRMFSPIRNPTNDLNSNLAKAWQWNGTSWIDDSFNNGQGKVLHREVEPLVDGLSIAWQDLQPASSKNLVANQYYIVSRCSAPNQVPIDLHTPEPKIYWELSLRAKEISSTTLTNLNNNSAYFIKEAKLGTTPDPLFYVTGELGNKNDYSATLNGETINVFLSASPNPLSGSVNLSSSGRIRTNSADNGKTLIINYSYRQLLDPTETPVTDPAETSVIPPATASNITITKTKTNQWETGYKLDLVITSNAVNNNWNQDFGLDEPNASVVTYNNVVATNKGNGLFNLKGIDNIVNLANGQVVNCVMIVTLTTPEPVTPPTTPPSNSNNYVTLTATKIEEWNQGYKLSLSLASTGINNAWKKTLQLDEPYTTVVNYGVNALDKGNSLYELSGQNDQVNLVDKQIIIGELIVSINSPTQPPTTTPTPTNPTTPPTVQSGNVNGVTPQFKEAVSLMPLFFEANQNGVKQPWNRVSWRGDAFVTDGQDVGRNLAGGYFDAGDHIITMVGIGMSFALTSASIILYPEVFQAYPDQKQYYLNNINWACKWIVDATELNSNGTVNKIHQWVGDPIKDHNTFYPPEYPQSSNFQRKTYTLTTSRPGTEPTANGASCLALSYKVTGNQQYLTYARALYDFANTYRINYSPKTNNFPPGNPYPSSGFYDELFQAAISLYIATNEVKYLNDASNFYNTYFKGAINGWFPHIDDAKYVALMLYCIYANDSVAIANMKILAGDVINARSGYEIIDNQLRAIKGVPWCTAAQGTGLGGMFAAYSLRKEYIQSYVDFNKSQADYIVGNNVDNYSYIVGITGKQWLQSPHHRGSSGGLQLKYPPTAQPNPQKNPYTLYGALIGGKSTQGYYGSSGYTLGYQFLGINHPSYYFPPDNQESRTDYVLCEVGITYNANAILCIFGAIASQLR